MLPIVWSTAIRYPRGVMNTGHAYQLLLGDWSASASVQRTRELAPVIKSRAEAQWQQPRLLKESIDDLQQAGLFQLYQPGRWGGHEVSPLESFEVLYRLAEADASVAWVVGVLGLHSFHLTMFEEDAQEEVWGSDPQSLLCSPYTPQTARRVEGGFLISGRWSFSTGSDYCEWALLGANIEGERTMSGGSGTHTFLIPRHDWRIEHNWKVYGLRGTGSNDILLDGVFVPEYRTVAWSAIIDGTAPGAGLHRGKLYQLPFFEVFGRSAPAPVALGALQGMIAALTSEPRVRRRTTSDSDTSFVLAEAINFVSEAKTRALLELAAVEARAEGAYVLTNDAQLRAAFQLALIPARAAHFATDLYRLAGGHGISESKPFGRYLADIQAIQVHPLADSRARALTWMSSMMRE